MLGMDTLLKTLLKAMGFEPESFLAALLSFQKMVVDEIDSLRAMAKRNDEQHTEILRLLRKIAKETDDEPTSGILPGANGLEPDGSAPAMLGHSDTGTPTHD